MQRQPAKARFGRCVGLLVAVIAAILLANSPFAAAKSQQTLGNGTSHVSHADTAWSIKIPALAGSVLHWSQYLYFSQKDTPDPANGHMLVGDLWEALGSNGLPTFYHARYVYPDGTFHQEIYQTPTSILIIFGQAYAKTLPHVPGQAQAPDWCIQRGTATPSDIEADLPLFADEKVLTSMGATLQTRASTRPIPVTSHLEGAAPRATYSAGKTARIWHTSTVNPLSKTTHVFQVELAQGGRVQVIYTASTDAQGLLIGEQWRASGSLDVYNPASVSAENYMMPNQVKGGCDR